MYLPMKYRYNSICKNITKFANKIISELIDNARNCNQVKKKFKNLKTGYDFLAAYISHKSSLEIPGPLLRGKYLVDFCKFKKEIHLTVRIGDGDRGCFKDGVGNSCFVYIYFNKIKCKQRAALRKKFEMVDGFRRFLVHELCHVYQYCTNQLIIDEKYPCPEAGTGSYNLDCFLYMMNDMELGAMLMEAEQMWRASKKRTNISFLFRFLLSECMEDITTNRHCAESFKNEMGCSEKNKVIYEYIFGDFIPRSKFANEFEETKESINPDRALKVKKILEEDLTNYVWMHSPEVKKRYKNSIAIESFLKTL